MGGLGIPVGSEIRLLVAAGNRDPAVFPDPDRFDPSRDNGALLTFGAGLHHCMGVHLARLELSTVLTAVHRRLPDLKLAGEPTWRPSSIVRGMVHLPITV